jgi:RNA polymerase sigma factor (sigma-70 family)
VSLLARAATKPQRESAAVGVGELFDEHAPMVLAICRYLLRDAQAAEDAAQETFLSAYRSLLGGTQPRDPPAWLATIARNECRRALRTARPAPPLDEATVPTFHDPADIVADRAELSEVADAIGKLPARQREALVLREFCGLSYQQVAAAMSVTEPVVDSLLSRARRGLSERFGDIPGAARGALVVPVSLREELARLIPGLDPAGAATAAGVASGAGGAATLASLGSAPVAAKVAATGVAAVALALPVQATLRGDEGPRGADRKPAAARQAPSRKATPPLTPAAERRDPRPTPATPTRRTRPRPDAATARQRARAATERRDDSSGPGPGPASSDTDSSGPGPGSAPDNSGPGSSSSGSGSSGSGSGSSGSGSGSSGSGSSGSGSSGPGDGSEPSSSDSGSGSSGSGSGSSGSGSSGSGSGSESSGSSGSGGSGSGSGSDDD